jgi:hypothetical protein
MAQLAVVPLFFVFFLAIVGAERARTKNNSRRALVCIIIALTSAVAIFVISTSFL